MIILIHPSIIYTYTDYSKQNALQLYIYTDYTFYFFLGLTKNLKWKEKNSFIVYMWETRLYTLCVCDVSMKNVNSF